jgi:hypothetical protein
MYLTLKSLHIINTKPTNTINLNNHHYSATHIGLSETSELSGVKNLTSRFTLLMNSTFLDLIKEGWIEDPV